MPPKYVDLDRLIELRRRLHRCPEIGFELHRTVAIVKEELDSIGIEYVADKYAPCSVVADINPEKKTLLLPSAPIWMPFPSPRLRDFPSPRR